MGRRRQISSGAHIHTPRHNYLKGERGSLAEAYEYETKGKMVDSVQSFKSNQKTLIQTTYGGTSKFINESNDIFAKVNGGQLASCIQNDYLKDYLIDMKMKDDNLQ